MYKIYIFMQKNLIRVFGAHCMKYVNFVHDPEKQYKSLSVAHRPGGTVRCSRKAVILACMMRVRTTTLLGHHTEFGTSVTSKVCSTSICALVMTDWLNE